MSYYMDSEKAVSWLDHTYPCTIIMTRYGGCYEGANWAAFACDEAEVPEHATAGDGDAEAFWKDSREQAWVGRGETPDAALADLESRLREIAGPKKAQVTRE